MKFSDMSAKEMREFPVGRAVHTARGDGVFSFVRFGAPSFTVPEAICVSLDSEQHRVDYQGTIFPPDKVWVD